MSINPPAEIDGAKVLLVAQLDGKDKSTGATRHSVSNFDSTVGILVVAKYDDSSEFYLFYCDDDWKVVTDTSHESVDEAVAQAEFEFSDVKFRSIN